MVKSLHKRLVGNDPAQTERREKTPAVIPSELGRTVISYGCGKEVTVEKTCVYASEV